MLSDQRSFQERANAQDCFTRAPLRSLRPEPEREGKGMASFHFLGEQDKRRRGKEAKREERKRKVIGSC